MTRVAVVGGGVAGLVAARRLALAGVDVTVFEASDALGGMLQQAQLGDVTIDIGAEAFAVRGGVVEAYLRELGLTDDLVEPRALGSWTYGALGAQQSPSGGMLGIPSGPDADGLEDVVGASGVAAVAAEASLDASVGASAASFAELIRARYGEVVLSRLVAPVTRGVYSLDPEVVDYRVLIPGIEVRLAEAGSLSAVVASLRPKATPGALVRGLRGGMHRFVGALVAECERLGVSFELNTLAGPFEPMAECEQSERIEARETDGPFDTAATPPAQGPSLTEFDAILITTESALTANAPTVSSEVVALLVDAPELDAHPRGTGVLVSDATDVEAKALTHVTAKWEWLDERTQPGQHILRLSYGPVEADGPARSLALSDEALQRQALADASRILGVELAPDRRRDFARHEWRMPMPAARLGRTAKLAAYRERLGAATEPNDRTHVIELCGAWIDGTGLASVLPSAENAAQRILDRFTDHQ
ncbi:protoporphyrinogen/coproporphyrinogen oxidase [Gulosibacter molinativorax]|uniref:FAD-binding protein n=1 Tax=Gulosibacter molinativorax TaxID=256821 RepID=A0ABT7C9T7_9MICO|nr:FAD-dependent oxidoreductase [Gulosibacter molinativorax]MDJ1371958.1 FAD-binding protein [Gulosibacter molinativorax]QUY62678.1 Protoporphyrinogen oxidase [Gulosibacter molinativorax]